MNITPSGLEKVVFGSALEWQFYIIAPFLISALLFARPWPILVLVICLATNWTHVIEDAYHFPSFLPFGIPYFAIGIASCFAWRSMRESGFLMPLAATACIIPLVAFFSKNIAITIWTATFFAILPGSLANILSRFKNSVPVKWFCSLGIISYPTYLCHWPVLLILCSFTSVQKIFVGHNMYVGLMLAFSIMFLPIVAISWILHVCVETPGNRFGSKVAKRL